MKVVSLVRRLGAASAPNAAVTRAAARLSLAILAAGCAPAYGWGEDGHSIVAEIAQRRLSPVAQAAVAEALGAGVSLASISSWADDIRESRPETANWHFVDIPLEASSYEETRDCPADRGRGDCVVRELARLGPQLCASAAAERRDALRFAVHFVADVHQPLHTVAEKKGGNQFPVHGILHGRTCHHNCELALDTGNLHVLWDSTLIRRTVWDWGNYVDRLEEGLLRSPELQRDARIGTPADWATQTHAVAREVWNGRLVPADGALDDGYYRAVLPYVDRQLALAGLRLAGFLNEAYGSSRCPEWGAARSR